MRKKILIVFETSWDRRQLEVARTAWSPRYEVLFAEPRDAETPWALDVVDYVAGQVGEWRGRIDGVLSSSDYPGATTAGAIASGLGLPGSPPAAILRSSHKYASRLAQREVVPEAVPEFWLLDPHDPTTWDVPFGFPCFVKPVKGAFSVMSGVIASREALGAFLTGPRAEWFEGVFLDMFDQLVRHFELDQKGRRFIAEGLLRGTQVTVEGWRASTEAGVLGIVDSVFAPGTHSFVRFDYPSSLPTEVQERMGALALAVTEHLGLVHTLFNVEMTWDAATDALRIVEINPRLCGQFSDLYRRVDGVSGYEVALALAAGDPVPVARRGAGDFGAASSYPLRVFRPCTVRSAPGPERVAEVEAAHPGTAVWMECVAGEELADFDRLEDGSSYRYGVVNLAGADRADVERRFEAVRADLGIVLDPRDA